MCGHDIRGIKMTTQKIVKALKTCPHCGSDVHVCKKFCYCGYQFYIRRERKLKKSELIDWKSLEKGDKIRLYCNDYFEMPNGETIDMGNSGCYEVKDIKEDGLVLFNKHGYVFQNMIKDGVSEVTQIVCNIPKIKRIKNEKRV